MNRHLPPLVFLPGALLLLGVGTTYRPGASGAAFSFVGQGCISQVSGIALTVGCRSLGTVQVVDAPLGSGCTPVPPTNLPEGMQVECELTAAGVVRIRQCTALPAGLTVPAGTYCAVVAKP